MENSSEILVALTHEPILPIEDHTEKLVYFFLSNFRETQNQCLNQISQVHPNGFEELRQTV